MTTTIPPGRTATVPALRQRILGPGRSTTRRVLLLLLGGLLVLSVLTFTTGLTTFTAAHDTADRARVDTVPAIGQLAAARSALIRADHAAITSLTAGGVELSGPGEEFQDEIAAASQSLTRVAELDLAEGSSIPRLVQGLVVTYTSMVAQADAHFRQEGSDALGMTDLWNASRLLHKADGGILSELDHLRDAQEAELDSQVGSIAMTPGTAISLVVPAVALLALLIITSVLFYRQFRRRVNPWLVLAMALTLTLTYVCAQATVSYEHLDAARSALHRMSATERTLDTATDVEGQQALSGLFESTGCGTDGACGATVDRYISSVSALTEPAHVANEATLAPQSREVTAQTQAASANRGLRPAINVLAALLAVALLLGFSARINEYRYRRQ